MATMDRAIRDQWVTALRSGQYQQGTGSLSPEAGKFCCLGVLCELAADAGVVDRITRTREYDDRVATLYGKKTDPLGLSSAALPHKVMNWAGLNDSDPRIPWTTPPGELAESRALSALNDLHRMPFTGIADLIQEHL